MSSKEIIYYIIHYPAINFQFWTNSLHSVFPVLQYTYKYVIFVFKICQTLLECILKENSIYVFLSYMIDDYFLIYNFVDLSIYFEGQLMVRFQLWKFIDLLNNYILRKNICIYTHINVYV